MNRLQKILIITLILIILWLLKGWFKDKVIVALGGYTTKTTTVKTDIQYKKGKIDTIAVFTHYVKTRGIKINSKPIIKYIKIKGSGGIFRIDSTKTFNVLIKDSLINGRLDVVNYFNGDLKSTVLEYKALFPKYIRQVDTLRITTTIDNTVSKERNLLGVGLGVSNLKYGTVLGSYTTKEKWQFIYEYGKSFEDTKHIINSGIFNTTPTDLHSVKVLKHF